MTPISTPRGTRPDWAPLPSPYAPPLVFLEGSKRWPQPQPQPQQQQQQQQQQVALNLERNLVRFFCVHEKVTSMQICTSSSSSSASFSLALQSQMKGSFWGSWIHPGRLTWNIIIEVWKIIFLSKWVICMFHVNLPGCSNLNEKSSSSPTCCSRSFAWIGVCKQSNSNRWLRDLTTTSGATVLGDLQPNESLTSDQDITEDRLG